MMRLTSWSVLLLLQVAVLTLLGCESAPLNDTYGLLPSLTAQEVAAAEIALTSSIHQIKEYELQYSTWHSINIPKIHEMMADGQMGYVCDIAVVQPGSILVVHQGSGRCCADWCGGPDTVCFTEPMAEPAIYAVQGGRVTNTYASATFFIPTSITIDPAGKYAWVTDGAVDQVAKVNLQTGIVEQKLGVHWTSILEATQRLSASAVTKYAMFQRLKANRPDEIGALCMPSDVAIASELGLVFVASGACDNRLVAFSLESGEALYDVTRDKAITGFDLKRPNSIEVDESKRILYIANQGNGMVDSYTYSSTDAVYICSWDLRPYGGQLTFSLAFKSGMMLASVDNDQPLSGAIVELDANACGVVKRAFPTPVGQYPQEHMDFWQGSDMSLHIYIASPWPEYYNLSAGAHAAEDGVATQVMALLSLQWWGVFISAACIPFCYFIHMHWDHIVAFFGAIWAWLTCQRPKKEEDKKEKKKKNEETPKKSEEKLSSPVAAAEKGVKPKVVKETGYRPLPTTHEEPYLFDVNEEEGPSVVPTAVRLGSKTTGLSQFATSFPRELASLFGTTSRPGSFMMQNPNQPGTSTGAARLSAHPSSQLDTFGGLSTRPSNQIAVKLPSVFAPKQASSSSSGIPGGLQKSSSVKPSVFAVGGSWMGGQSHANSAEVALLPKGSTLSPPSGQPSVEPVTTEKKGEGCVYFIRHGESTSNERGIFAGIYDVRLTKFGELQAKQAGKDIKTKRLQFDRVYCSHLRRTAYTAKNALEESGNGHLVPLMEHDSRIAERSFGIFAGQNIRLLQQSLGYHQYEELLHSPHQAPPMGEKIAEVYARVKNFYETEIIPKVAAGEKVLVVSHQYALEPLALYLCGLGPEDYNNMNLPNGKAMSVDDLRKYRNAESSPWKKKLQEIGDVTTISTFIVSPFLLVACVLIRMWIGHAIWPVWLSKTLLILSLFVSTFYSFLEVDLGTSVQKCPKRASLMVLLQVAFRILFGSVVLGQMHDIDTPSWDANDQQRQAYMCLTALLWLTPPAITVPSLSLLWGGGLYLAVTASLLLSGLLPVLLIIYVATGMVPGASMNSLSFFYSIFVVALVIPATAAHMCRQWKPIEVKKHSKDWKWLATPAYWIMLIVAVELYTPDSLPDALNISYGAFLERPTSVVPLDNSKRVQRIMSITCSQSFILMVVNFVFMRVSALLTAWVLSYWEDEALGYKKPDVKKGDVVPNNTEKQLSDNEKALRAMNCMDTYILLTTPNFFLFASMTSGLMLVNNIPVGQYMVFWAMFLWFLIPAFEQNIIANNFMSRLLQRSLGSIVQEELVQTLWGVFKDAGGDDTGAALAEHATDLVYQIHQLTTQDTLGLGSPTMRRLHEYTADQLKEALEQAAGQGSVQFDDFMKYFQRAGVAINLNLPDRPLKDTGGAEGSAEKGKGK